MRYVTNFSADIFSLLNSVIYFYKAVLELQRNRAAVSAGRLPVLGHRRRRSTACWPSSCRRPGAGPAARPRRPHGPQRVRGPAIAIVVFIAVPHAGELTQLDQQRPRGADGPSGPTSPARTVFFVEFWKLPIEWVFLSVIPAAIITVLFFFDHEISSIICTLERYGVRKPGGFAWDVALLGTTTALCGILGHPPRQRPPAPGTPSTPSRSATRSRRSVPMGTRYRKPLSPPVRPLALSRPTARRRSVVRVHEQRYSHFLQSALMLAFVRPPPCSACWASRPRRSWPASSCSWATSRCRPTRCSPASLCCSRRRPSCPPPPARGVSWVSVHAYTLTQLVLTAAIFALTLTPAAPAFPIVIILLVPARLLLMNRIWRPPDPALGRRLGPVGRETRGRRRPGSRRGSVPSPS